MDSLAPIKNGWPKGGLDKSVDPIQLTPVDNQWSILDTVYNR